MVKDFIVINKKKFEEMNKLAPGIITDMNTDVDDFIKALDKFNSAYTQVTGKENNQKYHVCNQDEPYAFKILEIILKNGGVQEAAETGQPVITATQEKSLGDDEGDDEIFEVDREDRNLGSQNNRLPDDGFPYKPDHHNIVFTNVSERGTLGNLLTPREEELEKSKTMFTEQKPISTDNDNKGICTIDKKSYVTGKGIVLDKLNEIISQVNSLVAFKLITADKINELIIEWTNENNG